MAGEGTVEDGPGAIVERIHFGLLASTASACVATSILCACTRSLCINLFQSQSVLGGVLVGSTYCKRWCSCLRIVSSSCDT